MTAETASEALERTISANSALRGSSAAAAVQLARVLARQVDEAGSSVPTRLSAAYLSCLKDLRRVSGVAGPPPASRLSVIQADAARVSKKPVATARVRGAAKSSSDVGRRGQN